MATIDDALFQEMRDDAPIAALVGNKIFPGIPPPTTKAPYITFEEISFTRVDHMDGATGLHQAIRRIDCWGSKAEEAIAIAEAVRTALDAFRGAMGVTAQIDVRRASFVGKHDDPEAPPDGGPLDINRRRIQLEIWHNV